MPMIVKQAAEAWRFDIPDEELDAIVPIVEELARTTARALDRDLSTTDPVHSFRPSGR